MSIRRVLVIGAGMAGLAAALELVRAGLDVSVVEARDRPGGRVLTLRDRPADGLYQEAGARYVLGAHDLTVGYLRTLGLGLLPLPASGDDSRYQVRGEVVRHRRGEEGAWPEELPPHERALGPDGLLFAYLGEPMRTIGDFTAPEWPSPALLAYDAISLADYLEHAGASPAAIRLMSMGGILNLVGEGIESLSLLWALRHLAGLYGGGQIFLIDGGSDRLPRALAAALGDRVRYHAPVTALEHRAGSVSVTYLHEDRPQTLDADAVVCTIPFQALRDIAIEPLLSPEKRHAIDSLAWTAVTRVFIHTRSRVWAAQGLPPSVSTDGPLGVCSDVSQTLPGSFGVVESYQAGEAARRTGALALAEQVSGVAAALEPICPGIVAASVGGTAYAWHNDSWARGAYSWSRPGDMATLEPHVGAPAGRVYFAGDHASPWPGWMQGALWSGLRAARMILAAD